MTYFLNAIKVMCSPKETKNLFEKPMSSGEKVRISSAMDAIDASQRKEVAGLTQEVLWYRSCLVGKDKVIRTIAAIHLSPDEWRCVIRNVGYMDQGLKDGEDLASVLKAVAALPKEKQDFCSKASCLMSPEMSAKDRVLIINAFASIDPKDVPNIFYQAEDMVKGLKSGEEKVLVLKALAKIHSDYYKDSIIWEARRNINDKMTVEERIKVLDLQVVSRWDSPLSKETMSGREKVQLMKALGAVPGDRIDYSISHLVTETMSFDEVLLLVNAAVAVSLNVGDNLQKLFSVVYHAKELVADTMNASDRVQILNAVASLPLDKVIRIISECTKLITNGMNASDRARLLNAAAALPSEERDSIIQDSKRLITEGMNTNERLQMLAAVAALPSVDRTDISLDVQRLIQEGMNIAARLQILEAVVRLPAAERSSMCYNARSLIQNGMNVEESLRVLAAMIALPTADRNMIRSCTEGLVRGGMTVDDRLRILAAVTALSSELRSRIRDDIANPAILSADEILAQLQTMPARRAAVQVNLYQAPTYLTVDIGKMDENPTIALEQLLDRFDADKTFPHIRYQTAAGVDEVGVDSGGMSRGVVSELMRALSDPKPPHQRKLPMLETDRGLVPKIVDSSELKSYRSVGMIFASALDGTKSILTGSHFNPVVFKMIHALTKEELDQIPPNLERLSDVPQVIQNKLLKLYFKSELRLVFGDKDIGEEALNQAIGDFVDGNIINEWMTDVSAITSKEECLVEQELNEILLANLVIAKAMQQRIRQPSQWDAVKGATADELQKKVEGSLTKDLVIASLEFSQPDETQEGFLTQWIQEATPEDLGNLVLCISSSTTLKQDQKLKINLQHASPNWPAFHTCFFQMDLPRYDSYEVFKEKLNLSIKHVVEGNKIGLS